MGKVVAIGARDQTVETEAAQAVARTQVDTHIDSSAFQWVEAESHLWDTRSPEARAHGRMYRIRPTGLLISTWRVSRNERHGT